MHIINHPTMDEESIRIADGLKKLEDLEFIFCFLHFEQIFAQTDVMVDVLQTKAMDVSFCKRHMRIQSSRTDGNVGKVMRTLDKFIGNCMTVMGLVCSPSQQPLLPMVCFPL